jgi:phosphopantetheinyl transferase (holo-ACP synthase)
MKIKCGNDVVVDKRIESLSQDQNTLQKIFHRSELLHGDIKKLASIFTLKESVFKALEISSDHWLEVQVEYKSNGKPFIILGESIQKDITSIDCSVSHSAGLTYGCVVLVIDQGE